MAGMLSREALGRRCRPAWAPERSLPPRAPDAGPLGITATLTALSPAEEPAPAADRIPRGPGPADDKDGSLLDPDSDSGDPAKPFVSACAAGIEASAEPMPSATASTPTRPVKRPDDIELATALLMLPRDWPSRLRDYPPEDRLHAAKANVAYTGINYLRPARCGPVAQAVDARTQKRAAEVDEADRRRDRDRCINPAGPPRRGAPGRRRQIPRRRSAADPGPLPGQPGHRRQADRRRADRRPRRLPVASNPEALGSHRSTNHPNFAVSGA